MHQIICEFQIEVKVTSEATLENAELSVSDRDSAAQAKVHK